MPMEQTHNSVAAGVGAVFIIVVAVALYFFFCYCYKRICEKAGKDPGVLIWIPIVQFIPLLQAAGMAEWMIILLLIPFVNIIFFVMMWAKICSALGKSPWLVIMLFIPILNIIFFPYLAFSE